MSNPIVSIIMGSDSDLKVMQEAADILAHFGIPHEVTIVSAHRTPERLVEFSQNAHQRGIRVIIAGAGGAAAAKEDCEWEDTTASDDDIYGDWTIQAVETNSDAGGRCSTSTAGTPCE